VHLLHTFQNLIFDHLKLSLSPPKSLSFGGRLIVAVTVIVTLRVTVIERVFVEWFVSVYVVMNTFHFISHLQIEAIGDLTGDVVKASHEASEVFHID
jgi:hypothetical protein